jgi:hypothetical protein
LVNEAGVLVLAEGTPAEFNPSQWPRLEQLTGETRSWRSPGA